jgi:glycerol uptake facilitator-like aquaporin
MLSKDALSLVKALVAECIGTLLLATTIGVGVVGTGHFSEYNFLFLPVLVGAVVGLLVYVLGPISGAQFNPAVTLALMIFGKLKIAKAALYVLVQVIGASAGFKIAEILIGAVPNVPTSVGGPAMLGEFTGAFILVAAVCAVVLGKIEKAASGLAIGMALTLGISLSLAVSGGILNPAIALALGGYHLTYLVAPLLGGIAGGGLVVWLYQES